MTATPAGYEPGPPLTARQQQLLADIERGLGRLRPPLPRWLRRAGVRLVALLAISGVGWVVLDGPAGQAVAEYVHQQIVRPMVLMSVAH
jgi:hypothetical protein